MGRYSLIQFVQDPQSRQGINVGVVLAAPGELVTQWTEHRDDLEPVQRFAELLDYLQTNEYADYTADVVLDDLAHRRFSQFVLTEPRQVEMTDGPHTTASDILELASHSGRANVIC